MEQKKLMNPKDLLRIFIFTPIPLDMIQFIFQMGWFNHQLVTSNDIFCVWWKNLMFPI